MICYPKASAIVQLLSGARVLLRLLLQGAWLAEQDPYSAQQLHSQVDFWLADPPASAQAATSDSVAAGRAKEATAKPSCQLRQLDHCDILANGKRECELTTVPV